MVASRYPAKSVYDRIADATQFHAIIELEALTNPRVREEAGDVRKIRPQDAVSGPGATPIMASFAYSGPSRFCDGFYGVYYAASDEATSITEVRYHTEKRLLEWHEPSIDVDKRMYSATITGNYDDIRMKTRRSPLHGATSDYAYTQRYARRLYAENRVDGIVYKSVRNAGGECVAVFRPRLISNCTIHKYFQFRWDGSRIVAIAELQSVRTYA